MTMLSIIQNHCGRSSLPIPPSAQSSSDPQVLQMVGLLQEFCDDMVTRKCWQANTVEAVFVSTAAEDQGLLETLAPGFLQILLESIYDRTQRLPLSGSVGPAEWQGGKALGFGGSGFRIRGNRLLFSPALPAGHSIAFEYYSSFFAQSADVVPVLRQYLTADTDTCTLGDRLPTAYLRWAWKKEKGFEYAEDFSAYERLVATVSARDARPQTVSLSDGPGELRPGIFVPYGSWSL